jgi:diguanylate cyclase (GGDEF)-like protein
MSTQADTRRRLFSQRLKYFKLATLYRAMSGLLKRAFDFFVALIGLILLSPFFIFIARSIKRDSPGPVFYWGSRVGKNGRIFRILKFRTMYENSQSYSGPRLTSQGDPRITRVGGWLRDTKINELPQLWNVLIGEMSLVGPRPEDPEIAKSWPEEARSTITSIRPGITSPASILYHDEEKLLPEKGSLDEYYKSILPDKIRLDLLYVQHHSFFSDIDTIFWTLFILVPRWAKLEISEGRFFAGPFALIAHRYVSWFVKDLLASLAVIGISSILWRTQYPLNWGVQYLLLLGVLLALLFSGVNSITGLNRIVWTRSIPADTVALIISCGCVTGLILVLNHFQGIYLWFGLPSLPPYMLIVIGLISGASFLVTRYRINLLSIIADWWLSLRRSDLVLGERVLLVGDGEASRIATWLLSRPMYRTAFSVVGIVNTKDPTQHGMKVQGYWMLGGVKDLPAIIKRHDVGAILSTIPSTSRETTEYIFDLCQKNDIRLLFLDDLMMMVDRQVTNPVESYQYPVWLDERLEYKAMHDAITGLPNRHLFQDRLRHSIAYARRYKSQLAVMFIVINRDDFDTGILGRRFDDQIMIEVTKRLAKCVSESDTLAYIGKNKFALILENIENEQVPNMVSTKMLGLLSESVKVEHFDVQLRTDICFRVSKDSTGYDELEGLFQREIENLTDTTMQKTEALDPYDCAMGE